MLRHLAKLRILYAHIILILSEFPEQLQCSACVSDELI